MNNFKQVSMYILAAVVFGGGMVFILFYLGSANNKDYLIPGLLLAATGVIIGSITQCLRRAKSRQRLMQRHSRTRSDLIELQETGFNRENQTSDEPPSYLTLYSSRLSLQVVTLEYLQSPVPPLPYSQHQIPGVALEMRDRDDNGAAVRSASRNDVPPTYHSTIADDHLPTYHEATTV